MEDYITRKIKRKTKNKYTYSFVDSDGNKVNDKLVKNCLSGLYIPPAHDDVKINLDTDNKIRAIGYDKKGRAQYVYNKKFKEKRSKNKFKHMLKFGESYKKIIKQINKDLYTEKESKNKQIASILKIVIECNFRIGNDKYSRENKSYGVTTLENRHIKVGKDNITIDFVGKKGVRNVCKLKNKKLSKNLRTKKRTLTKKDRIFTYRVNNKYYNVNSSDVNKYLKQFGNFTAKNFGTWSANIEFISEILKYEIEDKESKKKNILNDVLKIVADKLHNTASVCKNNYIDPYLIKTFMNDSKRFYSTFRGSVNKEDITDGYLDLLRNKI